MKKLLVFAIIMIVGMSIGCAGGPDPHFKRTEGKPAMKSSCTDEWLMSRLTTEKYAKVDGDTAHINTGFYHEDEQWMKRIRVTFVYADENCIVTNVIKRTFLNEGGEIQIKTSLPYEPNSYFYWIYKGEF